MKLAPAIRPDRAAGILTGHHSTAASRAKRQATRARRHEERAMLRDIIRFGRPAVDDEVTGEPRTGHTEGYVA